MRKALLTTFTLVFLFSSFSLFAQQWVDMMKNPDVNFYETQAEFNDYWSTRTYEKGKGYKQFRRWENFVEPRVYPKGDVKDAYRAKDEYQKWAQAHPELLSNERAANWTPLGPTGSPIGGGAGRINFVRFMPGTPTTIFAGAPAGGLWVSTNNGSSWTTNTDQLAVIGCTDIAIDPTNTQIRYLATGDGDAGDTYSIGVLKTTDGGTTWNNTGLSWTVNQGRTISKLLINPSNPQVLLAATSNGIYRTANGGTSWTQVQTGNFQDMEFKPTDPNTIYACGTTFWLSTNGGTSFGQITSGVPATNVGRLAIATTDANIAYVYLLAANSTNNGFIGVYRSINSGTSFTTRSTSPNLLGWSSTGGDTGGQGWYDLAIAASPTNADVVIVGGVNIWRSSNGGTNWTINGHWTGTGAPYVHADIHDLVFLPGNGTTYLSGNDGGVFRTTNSGTAWSDISVGMQIAQQYEIGLSTSNATLLLAGHQDNGTNRMSGATWTEVYGGDGMQCFIDRTNNNTYYAAYVNGDFQRSTNGGGAWTNIITGLSGTAAWEAPWHQDPVTANTLYAGYQQMFRSTNQGTGWTQIGTLTGTNTVVEFDIAPSNNQIIYAAKSNALFKTINGGTSWTTITGTLPVGSAAISYVEISPTDPNRVYVTFSGYSSGNKVFLSTNGGTTWTAYSTGLPNLPVNCIVYQTGTSDAVYAGTDVGVYYRDGSLATWQPYLTGLPNVVVKDLEIYYATGKIRAGTYGRGTWESDLYSPGTNPPVADFTADRTSVCIGQTINFTDISTYTPTSWSWTFGGGGTPNTSTAQNPSVVWNTPGTYTVTLVATNANGSDTETKTAYITVSTPTALPLVEGFENATFVPAAWALVDANLNALTWERNGTLGAYGTSTACAMFNNYNYDEAGARDQMWTPKYSFSGLTSATLTFDVAYARYDATYSDTLSVLVSTDCGQTFTQVYIKGGTTLATNGGANVTAAIFTPTTTQWRNESVSLNAFVGQSNVMVVFRNHGRYGQALYIDNVNITGVGGGTPPVADFTASATTICAGQSVTFTDISTNTPTFWSWTFGGGGTPNTSTAQNPTIAFNTPGVYTVTLTATNASGSDLETKTNYITVNAVPTATAGSNSPVCTGNTINLTANTVAGATYSWTGPGGFTSTLEDPTRPSATTAMAGVYTVTITANGCASTASNTTVVVNTTPTATAGSNSPVCTGNTINLTSNTVAGATYSWTGPGGFTSTLEDPTRPSATTTMAGVYTVTITANGCASTASNTTVVVNTTPTATAGSNSPVCTGNTINLTSNTVAGATYSWTGPGGYTSTLEDPTRPSATTVMAGTYTLTITSGGCTSAASNTTVVVNTTPTATAGSNSPVCSGATLNLTGNTVAGATYAWTGPNGFTSTLEDPSITSVSALNAGTYSLTITANGCSSVVSNTTVVVNTSPTATAGSNSPVCTGSTINLTGNTVAGATYSWTGPGGYTSSLEDPTRPSATALMAGTYTLTITSGGCTSVASNTTVVVNTTPTATAGSNSPVCSGSTINLTGNTVAGATYSWTGPGGYTSTLEDPTRPSATTVMAGTYTLTITASGCTSAASNTTVVVNTPPTATSGSNSPVCSGSTINLTSNTVAGATYSWTGPNGFTSALEDPSITNATAVNAGTYTLTITAGGCTSAASTTTVVVNTTPTATAGSNSPVCAGTTLNLTANTVAGATYSWTGPGGYTSTLEDPTRPGATIGMSGNYTVTITANGCSASSTIAVTVNNAPTASAGSNSPVCSGNTLNLTANTVAGATYAWTGPGGFTSSLEDPTRPSATTTMSGTYTVVISVGTCTATSSTTVTVNPSPTATAGSNSPVCVGTTLNLTSNTVAGATYAWTGPGGYTSTLEDPTRPGATAVMSGNYTVTITLGSCTATSTVAVTVSAPTATAGSNSPVCSGNTINLTANTVAGATYSWAGPGGYTSALEDPTRPSATTAMAGTYTVTITVGSCSATSSTIVTVNTTPTATAGSNSTVCAGSTLNLTANTVAGATYAWTGPGGYTSTLEDPTRPSATTAMSGNYSVTITNAGCSATSTVAVTIAAVPTATAGSNSPVCSGNTINLTANTVAGATYSWTGPNGFTSSAEDPSIASSTTVMSGIYTVTISNGSCSATSNVSVTVNTTPTAAATSNSPVCTGTGNSITLFTPTVAGATYAWTGPSFTSALQNPVRNTPTAAMAGAYTVTVTANGCTATSSTTVIVNTTPDPTVGSNSPVCEGGSLQLTSTTVTGTPTYAWTGPNGFTSSLEDPTINPVTLAAAGTYTLTVTGSGCTSIADVITVVINPSPVASASNGGPYCVGQTINLNAVNVSGATYAWSGPGGYTSTSEDPTRPSATTAMSGTYTLTVTTGGCSDISTTAVTVSISPAATATSNSPVCEGQAITLDAGNVAGASYSWTGPNGFTSTTEDPSIVNSTSPDAGTYTLTVSIGSCSNTASATVVVNPSPNADAGADQVICEGQSAVLNGSGGGTYLWTPNTALDSDTTSSPNANPSATSTYTLTVSMGSCSDTDSVTVTVNTLPANPTISQSGDTLTANPSTGFTYQWYLNSVAISGANSATYTATQNGDYMVEITDGNNCSSNSAIQPVSNVSVIETDDIISVDILPNPNNGMFTIAVNAMKSDNYSITVHNSIGQMVYSKEISISSGKSSLFVSLPSVAAGVYTLTLYNENGKAIRKLIID